MDNHIFQIGQIAETLPVATEKSIYGREMPDKGWRVRPPGYDSRLNGLTYIVHQPSSPSKVLAARYLANPAGGILVTQEILEVFQQFQLGHTFSYRAIVHENDHVTEDYHLLECMNSLQEDDLNYESMSFTKTDHIRRTIGKPDVQIRSQEDITRWWSIMRRQHGFIEPVPVSLQADTLAIKSTFASQNDLFRVGLDYTIEHFNHHLFITASLKEALEKLSIAGLTFELAYGVKTV